MTKTKSYKTTDGQLFEDINAARQHELESFLKSCGPSLSENAANIAQQLIQEADKIIDLLTLKPSSRPAARKVNRKKKSATVETPVVNVA